MQWDDYPDDWVDRRKQVLRRDDYECQHCGEDDRRLTVRHRTLLSEGGSNDLDNLETICQHCHAEDADRDSSELIFDQLHVALSQNSRIEITYESEPSIRKVDPYEMVTHEGKKRLAGYDHEHEATRLFTPEKIRSINITKTTFKRTDSKDNRIANGDLLRIEAATYQNRSSSSGGTGTNSSSNKSSSAGSSRSGTDSSGGNRSGTGSSGSSGTGSSSGGLLSGGSGGGGGGADVDVDCFIATASYGTPLAAEIDILRNFRDTVLRSSVIGRAFITLYYRFSPSVADWISRSERRRKAFRILLVEPLVRIVGRYQSTTDTVGHRS